MKVCVFQVSQMLQIPLTMKLPYETLRWTQYPLHILVLQITQGMLNELMSSLHRRVRARLHILVAIVHRQERLPGLSCVTGIQHRVLAHLKAALLQICS